MVVDILSGEEALLYFDQYFGAYSLLLSLVGDLKYLNEDEVKKIGRTNLVCGGFKPICINVVPWT